MRPMIVILTVVVAVSASVPAFCSVLGPDPKDLGTWLIETVDSEGDVGLGSSLVLDSMDIPHIGYNDWTNQDLKYANSSAGPWQFEIVDHLGDVRNPSMVLDGNGNQHFSYHDYSNRTLKYAKRTGSEWHTETIDSVDDVVGQCSAIALDGLDNPLIAYMSHNKSVSTIYLKYAWWDGTSWAVEAVDSAYVFVTDVSMALDTAGYPHIAYMVSLPQFGRGLRHAWLGLAGWDTEVVVDSESPGYVSIAIDGNDYVHVSYIDMDSLELKYARWNGFSWNIKVIDSDGNIVGGSTIALDSNGNPHIGYMDATNVDLKYAWWDGGKWNIEVVDFEGDVGVLPSMAIDSTDRPHISYYDLSNGDLKYAKKETWYVVIADVRAEPSPQVFGGHVNISANVDSSLPVSNVTVDVEDPYGLGVVGNLTMQLDPLTQRYYVNQTYILTGEYLFLMWATDVDGHSKSASGSFWIVSPLPLSPPMDLRAHLSETEAENVVLEWELPEDDMDVWRYEVLRGTSYSSDHSDYTFYASVLGGVSAYVDVEAGEGDPNDYFYVVCAADILGRRSCTEDQAAKFTRPLAPAPNLVSIPLIQSDESIETVLRTVKYDKAWFYDSFSKEWKWFMKNKEYRRGQWNVNHTMGIWVSVTLDSNLTIAGVVPTQTTIHLYEGWNLVSSPSFNASYTGYDLGMDTAAIRVEGHDPSPPYHLRVLGDAEVLWAGYGYWVLVGADTTWTVNIQ